MADVGNSLVGDIGKPAEALINRISDAIGGIAKPWQLKRVAKAEAEAEVETAIILAEGEQKLSELQKRSLIRLAHEEARKQENIEDISYKAIPHLKNEAAPDGLDDDWIATFFDQARNVSKEEMREVWARVLAAEANNPETIPLSTLSILKNLGSSDAQKFEALLSLSKEISGFRVPVVGDASDQIVLDRGLDFDQLSHLDDLGLITFDHVGGYNLTFSADILQMSLNGKQSKLIVTNGVLPVGMVRLSFAGRQIAKCLKVKRAPSLDGYLRKYWKSKGVRIEDFTDHGLGLTVKLPS